MTENNDESPAIEAVPFLKGGPGSKRRWRAVDTGAEYITPQMFWTGKGRDGLEVAYATVSFISPVIGPQ